MGHGKPGKSWNLIIAGEHWSLWYGKKIPQKNESFFNI